MTEITHIPVLLEPSIELLEIKPGDIVVDGTYGGGGHSGAMIDAYKESITLICTDLDEAAQTRFDARFGKRSDLTANVHFVHANFKDAEQIMASAGVSTVNKVLLDLGTSTFQLLADERGFSFQSDTPLAMTFSKAGSHTGFTAFDIVNEWREESIADIVYNYGEEPKSRIIAKAIVEARKIAPILTSRQLAEVIESVVPQRNRPFGQGKRIHPATKTFQALRIAVNDELAVITEALENWWKHLSPGGRIAVITFHSLEDRVVKRWMADKTPHKRVITKKVITPSDEALQENKRARSAKLRVVEKEQ
ncbi:MAG TPA: 16S rRNA (cytosine(1402)-N(4))-methyltransferase RsmH [Candidatus Paceibacterota bacterium]